MKRPSFQFYPADWRKDMALQSCSVAARGLWVDLLCIAHECEPYGHLTVNGKAMTAAQIGRHTGLTERECVKLIAELEDSGVLSRTEEGAIFSRRMVRDEEIRMRRAEGGKAGSEFGALGAEHGKKGGRPRKETGDKKPPSQPPKEPPPSSSSSSSSSSSEGEPSGSPPQPPVGLDPTPSAAVCIALKAAGIANVNPSHPLLHTLVEAGATPDEFVAAARQAAGKSNGFAYVLAVVRGERERAAQAGGVVHRGPLANVNRQEAVEQRNRAVGDAWLAEMEAQDAAR